MLMCKPTTLDAIMEGVEMNNSSHPTNAAAHHKHTNKHHIKNATNTPTPKKASVGCSIIPKRSVTKRSANGIGESNNDDLDFDYAPSSARHLSLAAANSSSSSSTTAASGLGCSISYDQFRSSPDLEVLLESDSFSSTTKTASAPSLEKSADNISASRRKSSRKIVKWLTGALKSKSNSINKQIVNPNRDNSSVDSSKDSGNNTNNSGKVRRVSASHYTT